MRGGQGGRAVSRRDRRAVRLDGARARAPSCVGARVSAQAPFGMGRGEARATSLRNPHARTPRHLTAPAVPAAASSARRAERRGRGAGRGGPFSPRLWTLWNPGRAPHLPHHPVTDVRPSTPPPPPPPTYQQRTPSPPSRTLSSNPALPTQRTDNAQLPRCGAIKTVATQHHQRTVVNAKFNGLRRRPAGGRAVYA